MVPLGVSGAAFWTFSENPWVVVPGTKCWHEAPNTPGVAAPTDAAEPRAFWKSKPRPVVQRSVENLPCAS